MSSESSDEFSEIRGALGSIGLSALIVLGGSILSQAMGFGTRVVMTRFLPVDGYGEIVLGITTLNIFGIVSILGLGQGLTRYLPRADSSDEQTEITASIYQIGIGLSLFWALVGFVTADFIAGTVFNSPGMANIVRISALSLPFYVLFKLSLKGIQGHKETTPNVVTKQLIRPGVQLVAIAVLSLAGFGVVGLTIGYNLGFAVAGLVGFIFFFRTGQFRIRSLLIPSNRSQYRDLLAFSLPLAVSGSFTLITKKSDLFLLGVLDTSSAVGIYDVAILLSQFILFFHSAIIYLFQPIMSEYDSEGALQRMDRLYKIATRWIVVLTFPIFTLFVLFPKSVIGISFGAEYQSGGIVLILASMGFYAARFVGPTGILLTAIGNTKVLMYISGVTALLNLGLNVLLIPFYGIVGAAIATIGSTLLNNIIQSIYIYKFTGIHPFTRELLTPLGISLIFVMGVGVILPDAGVEFSYAFTMSSLMGVLLIFCIIFTRSIYLIELKLADALLEKMGLNLNLQERLKWFGITR